MSDYFIGVDVLGADDWGVPTEIVDPAWGVPTEIEDPAFGVPVYVSGDDIALRSMMDVMKQIDLDRDFVVGMEDISARQQEMNQLKQVPVRVANVLLKHGLAAINGAIADAKQPWYRPDLPGGTARNNALGHLQWHQNTLSGLAGKLDDNYASGDDLKKYVMQAFIEANAVSEGASTSVVSFPTWSEWKKMWTEIGEELAKLPAEMRKAAFSATNWLVRSVTGLPIWAWGVIGLTGLLIIGGVVYAIINSKSGAAITTLVTKKYLRSP